MDASLRLQVVVLSITIILVTLITSSSGRFVHNGMPGNDLKTPDQIPQMVNIQDVAAKVPRAAADTTAKAHTHPYRSNNRQATPSSTHTTAKCTAGFSSQQYFATIKERIEYGQGNPVPVTPPITTCTNETDVIYSMIEITGNGNASRFSINNSTGEIYLNGTFDYEKQTFHRLFFSLTKKGGKDSASHTAGLVVILEDVNDNAPVMSQRTYTKNITESTPVSTYILNVVATDADSGINAKFEYQMVKESSCPLMINKETGEVRLLEDLDYEKHTHMTCKVYAKETHTSERYASNKTEIILNVIDVNDNVPAFTKDRYSFVMGSPLDKGQFVGNVVAYDRDSGSLGTVEYSIESPVDAHFNISSNGSITVRETKFDRFNHPGNFTFLVLVCDGGDPSLTNQAQVQMIMKQGYIRWSFTQSRYNFSVLETSPINTEVGQVGIYPFTSKVDYNIIHNYTNFPFTITRNGGTIRLSNNSATLSHQEVFFTVSASDNVTSIPVNVTVTVIDLNDHAPEFMMPNKDDTVVQVDQIAMKDDILYTVNATDADFANNGLVSYSINSRLDGDKFSINDTTGEIFLKENAINSLYKDEYRITIEAKDHGSPSRRSSREIIFRVGRNTTEEYIYIQVNELETISQSLLVGTFANMSETDVNFIIDVGINGGIFTVVNHNVTSPSLDYEKRHSQELIISVTGRHTNRTAGTIHIAVAVVNVNDNTPEFIVNPTSQIDIPYTAVSHSVIYQFIAVDKDTDEHGYENLTYSFKNTPKAMFEIDPHSGVVTLTRIPGPGSINHTHTLTAVVTDQDNHQNYSSSITVRVFNSSEGYPHFSKTAYAGSVQENQTVHTSVLVVNAQYGTFPSHHEVALDVLGGNNNFMIVAQYGELRTNAVFDREIRASYPIAIQATTLHVPIRHTIVFARVDVIDVNDNAPQLPFSVNRTTVAQAAPHNVTIARIAAVDLDSHANLTYSLSGNDASKFSHQTQDNIMTLSVPDPSALSGARYSLQVTVNDGTFSNNSTLIVDVL